VDLTGHYLNLLFNKNTDELRKKTTELQKLLGRMDEKTDPES